MLVAAIGFAGEEHISSEYLEELFGRWMLYLLPLFSLVGGFAIAIFIILCVGAEVGGVETAFRLAYLATIFAVVLTGVFLAHVRGDKLIKNEIKYWW